jgi:hypothetical protein
MDTSCISCGSRNVVEDEHEGQALVVCSDCGHVSKDTAQANLDLQHIEYNVGFRVDASDTGIPAGTPQIAGFSGGSSTNRLPCCSAACGGGVVGLTVDLPYAGHFNGVGREGVGNAAFKEASRRAHWQDEVRRVSDQLSLSTQTLDLVLAMVGMAEKDGYQRTFSWTALITACAYIVIRQEELPFTLRDVGVATGVHVHKIARCFRQVFPLT